MTTEAILKMGDKRKILDDNMLPHNPQIVAAINSAEQFVLQSPEVQALRKDAERLDWLSDPENNIGNVQLPISCVENNLHSLRGAIDEAMEQQT